MAASLYSRVLARGFPPPPAYSDSPEVVGASALASQGGPADPAHGENVWGPSPSTLTGFSLEGPGAVSVTVLGDLPGPGSPSDPNQSPGYGPGTFRSHAAPWPQPVLGQHDLEATAARAQESMDIHAVNFGGLLLQDFMPGQSPGDVILPMNPSGTEDYGDSNQAPLSGAQRVLGGRDSVQGYGGGGDGPGGVNAYGYSSVRADHLNISGNVVNAYLDPAERPFFVPQAAGTYIPTDAVTGPEPFASFFAADGVSYHDPSPYQPVPEPATLQAPLAEATAWGW